MVKKIIPREPQIIEKCSIVDCPHFSRVATIGRFHCGALGLTMDVNAAEAFPADCPLEEYREWWVNLYPNGKGALATENFGSEAEAREHRGANCIATVELERQP